MLLAPIILGMILSSLHQYPTQKTMIEIIGNILWWILEALTFGIFGRESPRRSSKSILKSLFVFLLLVLAFLLIYRFVVNP